MRKRLKGLSTAVLTLASSLTLIGTGAAPAAADTHWNDYEKITLSKNVGEPTDLAVLPDKRVLHASRDGVLRLTDPANGVTRTVNTFPVHTVGEDGLQNLALDPGFATNRWVWVYYAPALDTPNGNAPGRLPAGADDSSWAANWERENRLSRFKWTGEALDLDSEQIVLRVPATRGLCCHVGGDIDWDAAGNLYLSTGDDTNPFESGNYTPIDDSPGRNPGYDARRTSGNTNDLRGKILRIKVNSDTDPGYTVPAGNLFAPGTDRTRPEIFVMGLRNPFRMNVDRASGIVTWGEYGPDAGAPNPDRGPLGYVEWQATGVNQPLNAGWPFCTGPSFAYNDYDFATSVSGPKFDCAAPVNDSRWNTGLTNLPPMTGPTLYYGDNNTHQPWPELTDFTPAGGQAPMGGPLYRYDAANPSTTKFPAHWDGKWFFAEWSQDYVAAFTLTGTDGPVTAIEHFLPNTELTRLGQPVWDNVMDMEFGPDGSLYVLEYGDGFNTANPDAQLSRVDHAPGNKTPQARITATPTSGGTAPLTVDLSAAGSVDPEGSALTYEWDVDGDGDFDATGATARHTYTANGQYQVGLRVTDAAGRSGVASREITVGNTAPTVTIVAPANGGFFANGNRIPFSVTVTDAEDGSTPVCSRVRWTYSLGHEQHAHPLLAGTGCTGSINTPANAGHAETENIFGVLTVTYRDNPTNGQPGALGESSIVLNPKTLQAEHADTLTGATVVADPTTPGNSKVTGLDAGDALVFDPVSLSGITGVTTRASGAGTLSLRTSATATPFATVTVPAGAGWQDVTTSLTGAPTTSGPLFVTSTGGVEIDAFTFVGAGVADVTGPTVAVTATPAAPTGTNGWYTAGPVTVNLAYSDVSGVNNGSRQYRIVTNANDCGAAGATWLAYPTGGNVTVTAEGTTVICYRGNDAAGNTTTGSFTVRIDSAAPTVTLPGIVDGQVSPATYLVPAVADAAGSSGGLVVTAMTLDGAAWNVARPINVATLSLGSHTVTVTARDAAGNSSTTTVTFTVVASYAGLTGLVDRYEGTGAIDDADADALRALLTRAQAEQGNRSVALLNQFKAQVRRAVDASAVRTLLLRDADALIAAARA